MHRRSAKQTPGPAISIAIWRNEKSRRWLIQSLAALVFLILAIWLGSNLDRNLTNKNIAFGFEFLRNRASFDIGEAIVTYSPADAYSRAIWVGLLNSVRVSAIGIVLATLLGTAIGIGRLSSNWLARTLARAYVEILRNTPLLLQLLFWYFIAFVRSDAVGWPGISLPNWQFTDYTFSWLVAVALGTLAIGLLWNAGRSWSPFFRFGAIGFVILLAVTGLAISSLAYRWPFAPSSSPPFTFNVLFLTPFGLSLPNPNITPWFLGLVAVATLAVASTWLWPKLLRPQRHAFVGILALATFTLIVVATRNDPFLEIPQIDVENPNRTIGGLTLSPEFSALLLGLTLYTAAFIAEIVRAGLESVPRGQWEAARALGLRSPLVLRLVIFPQALRAILPPLTSEYLNLWKNSSLAAVVGYPDLYFVASTTFNQTGRAVEVMLLLGLAYLTISLLIASIANWVNRAISLPA
ncbi:MAG: ABC transporter permease subunit [Cyanobacteria bacterium J06641_5]